MGPQAYRLAFQSAVMYVKAPSLSEESITYALGKGRSFMAFEFLGPADSFTFTAEGDGRPFEMGDEFSAEKAVFHVHAPKKALLRLICNGQIIAERKGRELVYLADTPSVCRAEAYKGKKVWILSNPIYWKER